MGPEGASSLKHWTLDEYNLAHKRDWGHNGGIMRLGQDTFDWVELHSDIRHGHERWVASKQPNPAVQQDLAQELMINEKCCKHTNMLNV